MTDPWFSQRFGLARGDAIGPGMMPISGLRLSGHTQSLLASMGIVYVYQLLKFTPSHMANWPFLGPARFGEIVDALSENGFWPEGSDTNGLD